MRRVVAIAAIALFACVLGFMVLADARGDIAGRHPRQPTDTVVVAPTASHADDQADRLRSLEQRVEALTADLEALRGEHRLARPGSAVQQSPQTPAPTEEDAFLAQHRDSILGLIDDDARRRAFESAANALREPLQRIAEHYHWDAAALTPIVLDYRRRIFDLEWQYCPRGLCPESGSAEFREYDEVRAAALRDYETAMRARFSPSAARDVLVYLASGSWAENR